jgi:hypothetical protein
MDHEQGKVRKEVATSIQALSTFAGSNGKAMTKFSYVVSPYAEIFSSMQQEFRLLHHHIRWHLPSQGEKYIEEKTLRVAGVHDKIQIEYLAWVNQVYCRLRYQTSTTTNCKSQKQKNNV